MPAGNIQLHLHRNCIAIRLLRWIIQFNFGWGGEWTPKVLCWRNETYWIDWLWLSVFIKHESPMEYHTAIGQ